MLVTTEAIVLSKINYSETSLIVRCYTLSDGVKSYLVKGSKQGRNGKKPALFQPLNQLEITSQHKANSSLSIPKSTKISNPYQTIPYAMNKLSVVLFLSEVLSAALKEEKQTHRCFSFCPTVYLGLMCKTMLQTSISSFCYPLPNIWGFP